VDGVPVPAGISGSLNELFDPQVVNQIDFQTGGVGRRYLGNKNAAVVKRHTRIPSGGFHSTPPATAVVLGEGQSLNLSTNGVRSGVLLGLPPGDRYAGGAGGAFDSLRGASRTFITTASTCSRFAKVQFVHGSRTS